jgi:5-methylcytosine-specific restriction endonuclease McrA
MKSYRTNDEHVSGKKSGSRAAALQKQDGHSRTSEAAALQIWKQFEDLVVPQLKLSAVDHAVYSYLLRHSRLEGKRRLHLSMYRLGRGTRLSAAGARNAVRRLVAKGALRLVERSKAGHVIEVRLPEEIRLVRTKLAVASSSRGTFLEKGLEKGNFWKDKALRQAIHRREGGACFYCLRRVKARLLCIDHVVPQVRCGPNSYRNLVSSCGDCNAQKGEEEAGNFLRKLYREEKLTLEELNGRLRALRELAAGKLRPAAAESAQHAPA